MGRSTDLMATAASVENFLACGVGFGGGKRPGISAIEHDHEQFFAFIVIAAVASARVMSKLKANAIAAEVLGEGGSHQVKNGKNDRAHCGGGALVLAAELGRFGGKLLQRLLLAVDLQGRNDGVGRDEIGERHETLPGIRELCGQTSLEFFTLWHFGRRTGFRRRTGFDRC